MEDPKLTIIVATARPSHDSLLGLPHEHLFGPCFRSLAKQTCDGFELVIADSLSRYRDLDKEIRSLGRWKFPWKVVPITGGFWQEKRMWSLQYAFNTAAVESDGVHLMFSGDACEFPPTVVEKALNWISKGYQPHPMVIYKLGGNIRTIKDAPTYPMGGGHTTVETLMKAGVFTSDIVCDSRFKLAEEAGGVKLDLSWSNFFANGTIHRDHFFRVLNCFDESFDGEKSLGDVEIGSRLEMAGVWKPVIDTTMFTYEHSHGPCDERLLRSDLRAIRSNYDLIYALRARRQIRANCYRLSSDEIDKILNQTQYCLHYTPDDPEWSMQQEWVRNQSNVDYHYKWRERRLKSARRRLNLG